MNFTKKLLTSIALIGVAAVIATATPAGGNGGAAAFEQLKALVGDWQTETNVSGKATLHMELTAGGTALLEKFHMEDNGKPVEMITLYYVDGDQVIISTGLPLSSI